MTRSTDNISRQFAESEGAFYLSWPALVRGCRVQIIGDVMTDSLDKLIEQYCKAGWTATRYPRKKLVALNGFPCIPEKEAIVKMRDALRRTSTKNNQMPLPRHLCGCRV